jgi:hypothetical protein
MEWTVVEDAETLDSASILHTTHKFQAWVKADEREETQGNFCTPRYYYFVYVDEESLESVINDEKARDQAAGYFYKIVFPASAMIREDARLAGEIPVDQDPLDEQLELLDCIKKIKLGSLVPLYVRLYRNSDSWYNIMVDLSKVQWTYLGIAAFVTVLAVVFYFAPIPEVTDADMELQAEMTAGLTGYEEKPMRRQYKLFFGVAAQFCYVVAQLGVAANFINYAVESTGITHAAASDRYAIGQGLFAAGRFAAAGAMMYIKPRWILLAFMTAIMLFIALATGVWGEAGVAMLSLVLFFESCIFPTIFTLSIRGLGRHTKRGSSWIVAAVSGGALFR